MTYYIDFPPIKSDVLNVKFLEVLKYTPLFYAPIVVALVLFLNYFAYDVQSDSGVSYLDLIRRAFKSERHKATEWALITLGALILVLIVLDMVRCTNNHRKKYKRVHGDENSYFERLSNLDRLRWLAHESLMR